MFEPADWNRLYQYCFSLTKDPDAAYDLLQSAMERLLQQSPGSVQSAKAYVRSICRNLFIDQYRRQHRYPTDSIDDTDPVAISTSSLEQVMIDKDLIGWVFAQLSPEQSELIYLWSVEGMTAKEIASELHIPIGSVLSRIHRIRKKLNKLLDEPKPEVEQ